MSSENKLPPAETAVQALLAKYQSDSAFKAAFDAAGPTEEAVRVAAQHGITVTLRDVLALGPASKELSDALLEQVSGGSGQKYTEFSHTFN